MKRMRLTHLLLAVVVTGGLSLGNTPCPRTRPPNAPGQSITWSHTYEPSTGSLSIIDIDSLEGGGFLAWAHNAGGAGSYLIWLDKMGDVQASKLLSTAGISGWHDQVEVLSNGDIMLLATVEIRQAAAPGYRHRPALVRLDSNGAEIWRRTFDVAPQSPLSFYVSSFCQLADGGFAISGTDFNSNSIFLIRTDSTGTELGTHYHNYAASSSGTAITACSDGGVALLGTEHTSSPAVGEWLVVRTYPNGTKKWKNTYLSTIQSSSWPSSISALHDGGFVVAGTVGNKAAMLRIGADGTKLWSYTYHPQGPATSTGNCAKQTGDGAGLVLAGGCQNCLVHFTGMNGTIRWSRILDGGYLADLECLQNGGIVFGGTTENLGTYLNHLRLARGILTNSSGIAGTRGVRIETEPADLAPNQNFLVRVITNPRTASVQVSVTVEGSDGYRNTVNLPTDWKGEVAFHVPGAARGVVDHVHVHCPALNARLRTEVLF